MIKTMTQFLMLGIFASLVACGGGSSSTSSDSTSGGDSSVSLVNAFGEKITVDSIHLNAGVATACYNDSGSGTIQNMSISGSVWSFSYKIYNGDLSCSNTPTVYNIKASLKFGSDTKIKGWGNNGAPTKASDAQVTLAADASYTPITITVTESNFPNVAVGYSETKGYIIDDSQSGKVVLYEITSDGFGRSEDPYVKTF